MPKLKIGSLFSGYGGLDLGVMEVLDAEVVWHCEWEDAPSAILDAHWPDVPNYRDVSKVDWASVEPVDILTGGFPCQDVSLAGARRGLQDGTRSGLWSEFAKAIEILKPRLVVIENVRGLLSAGAAVDELEQCAWCMGDESGEPSLRALGAVLGSLADIGYDAEWCGLRAADAGAPHGRFRVFITAWPSGDSYADSGRFKLGGGATRTVTKTQPYRGLGLTTWAERAAEGNLDIELLSTPTTQPSSGKCRDHGGDLLHDVTCGCPRAERREKLLPTVMANEAEKGTNLQNAEQRAKTGQVMITNVAQTIVQDGSVWGQYEPSIRRWESITGREAPAPTLPDGRDGQQRLSPLLTEWMMGLPEGWITSPDIGISRNDQIKAAGNGVVPQQAVLALRYLLRKGNDE